ncbi:MAG TPA: group II intron reverse transcriptase/maturase [Treponemataceae bacterium]|nr:group II intron reverse transcriptase/maturase [Treponemataceae bacterium]
MDSQKFWESVSTKQRRIAEIAQRYPEESLKSLAHHIDEQWLYCAYELTRKDGAKGIDGLGAKEYEQNLWANLTKLLDAFKSGSYRAPSVRRVYIPKAGSTEKRPLGIPTYEDKILQRAVQMVLEPIYEQKFYDVSYGFRSGKSAHQALERIWKESMNIHGGYIIDMDISKYFDTIPHKTLQEIIKQRVSDGVLIRTIGKWLNAGVMDKGLVQRSKMGAPQGGVISPILSNIYLHEVLDDWFIRIVKPRLRGKAFLVRYADDAVIGCEFKEDAERILKVLPLRFTKYGLTLHPEKTRLVDFSEPKESQPKRNGSFPFLGFLHYWKKSQKGRWIVVRKTDKTRLNRSLESITQWCRNSRNKSIQEQHRELSRKLKGHYAYYGITFNSKSINQFFSRVVDIWFKWLNRRSDKRSLYRWQYQKYLRLHPLPYPKIVHSYC